MKEIKREKTKPIYMEPGDSITLTYTEEAEISGKKVILNETEVLSVVIDKPMVTDEAVIFQVEEGDFKGAKGGIGGAFLISEEGK